MTGSFYWSASAGRWMGVPVRLHVLLFLFIAVIFGVEDYLNIHSVYPGTAIATSMIVSLSLILHELAHVFAISNLGGHVNSIVLTPWGGNSDFALPPSSRDRAIIHTAGPFASLMIALLCGMVLLQAKSSMSFASLVNPFNPHGFDAATWEFSVLKITAWVNFQLVFVNLIPCFPFDFAGILRACISKINSNLPRVRTETTIMVIGHSIGLTMIGMAWVLRGYDAGPISPIWLFLVMGGIAILFSTRYSFFAETAHTDDEWDSLDELEYESFYEDSAFYEFPEDENDGHSQWLSEKQEARKREEARREAEEDRIADSLLDRVHQEGISSLSEDEKQLLQRVSARIRARRDDVLG